MKINDRLYEIEERLQKSKNDLRNYYKSSVIPVVREVARQCGYCIGEHGSLIRDCDVMAIPWVKKAVSPKTLVDRITLKLTGEKQNWKAQPWSKKPHGRMATSIMIGMHAYVDISVISPKK